MNLDPSKFNLCASGKLRERQTQGCRQLHRAHGWRCGRVSRLPAWECSLLDANSVEIRSCDFQIPHIFQGLARILDTILDTGSKPRGKTVKSFYLTLGPWLRHSRWILPPTIERGLYVDLEEVEGDLLVRLNETGRASFREIENHRDKFGVCASRDTLRMEVAKHDLQALLRIAL